MDATKFLEEFHDFLAPRLDTYEQAIYLYCIRHTRLVDKRQEVIGIKSARTRMAFGIGKAGSRFSESVCSDKLRSLQEKGCLKLVGSEHYGTRIETFLPHEIPGLIDAPEPDTVVSLEGMDFFKISENREQIFSRENGMCFYCLRTLTPSNFVIEHVVSRPTGDNSYRNVVAGCRECNNRKGALLADDFLRTLYRGGLLTQAEFEDRLSHLERLREGLLKPPPA